MFCKNCGKQIDDDSKFCMYCGTSFVESAKPVTAATQVQQKTIAVKDNTKDKPKDKKKTTILIIVLVCVALLFICMLSTILGITGFVMNSSESSGTQSSNVQIDEPAGGGIFGFVQKKDSATSLLTGEKLTATPGGATLLVKKEQYLDEVLALPEFGSYCGEANGFSEMYLYDTVGTYSKKSGYENSDIEADRLIIESYLDLLEEKYNFSVEMTNSSPPDKWLGQFIYGWLCTHNGGEGEIFISYSGIVGYTNYLEMTYYSTMEFIETDSSGNLLTEASAEVKSYTLIPEYSTRFGNSYTLLEEWEKDESLWLIVNTDMFSAGDTITLKDFKDASPYANQGNCYFAFQRYLNILDTSTEEIGHFKDLKAELLYDSNGYPALYFYAQIYDGAKTLYHLEGITAPGDYDVRQDNSGNSGGGNSGGATNSGGVPSVTVPGVGETDCAFCDDGYQECHFCTNGFTSCTLCHGTGTYSNYGERVDCSCLAGKTECTFCNGKGATRCTYCNGTGKK